MATPSEGLRSLADVAPELSRGFGALRGMDPATTARVLPALAPRVAEEALRVEQGLKSFEGYGSRILRP
jgi:hypothetical protein